MKIKFASILILSILSIEFLSCNKTQNVNMPELAVLALRAIRLANQNQVVLNGTVKGPGSVSNAKVHVFGTPSDGQCVTTSGALNATPLATAISDANGNYSISYAKTGANLCVVVVPGDGSKIDVFSPQTKANIPKTWSGGNNLMAIIKEPSNTTSFGLGSANKTVNVTPFTRMAARRFSALSAISSGTRSRSKVFLRVIPASERAATNNKVQFGSNTATTLLDKATGDVENAFFPKRDKNNFSLESASVTDPGYALKLGSIAITADKIGGGVANGSSTSEDFEKVINFMEEDFSDGRFDGKKIDPTTNKIAKMTSEDFGGVVSSTKEADKFLTSTFKAALKEYDSYDTSITSTADDLLFCDSDTVNAACSIAVLPGSPPEIWIYDNNEEFVDSDEISDVGPVGYDNYPEGTSKIWYFIIVNGGGLDLTLTTPITIGGSQFTIIEQPESVIAPGDAAYLGLQFIPTAITTYSQPLTVLSNDTLYSPYNITLTGSGEDLSSSIALLWTFDDGDATDYSGNLLTGNVGTSTTSEDRYGNEDFAFYFDSSNPDSINGAYTAGSPFLSISAWASPDDFSNPADASILSSNPITPNFWLGFTDNGTNIRFIVDTGSPVTLDYPVNPDEFLDVWNHFAGVYDGTDMILYINGEEVDRISQSGTVSSGGLLFVGSDVSASGTAYYSGYIDEVRIYERDLTATQVFALFNQD